MILYFPLKPEMMEMDYFGLFKYSAKTSITFSFAFPSIGGTVTRMTSVPSVARVTSFFLAFGLTVILSFIVAFHLTKKPR